MAALAFTVLLALCLGGGTVSFLVVQAIEPHGAATPRDAVEGFLRGVFTDRSADPAEFICTENRDDKDLARLVFQVRELQRRYSSSDVQWTYPPLDQASKSIDTTVTLHYSTVDGKTVDKPLRMLLVNRLGWWVCEVETPQ
jgi:hypothetical protein